MDVNLTGLARVIHAVIDGLGAGHAHLHGELDEALGTGPVAAPPPPPSDEEIAAAQALLARVAPAATAAAGE